MIHFFIFLNMFFFFHLNYTHFKTVDHFKNNTVASDSLAMLVQLHSSAVSVQLSSESITWIKNVHFSLQCSFHLIYHLLHIVTSSSPSVRPFLYKGFLGNFYHDIECDDDCIDEFRFKDASTQEGRLQQKII